MAVGDMAMMTYIGLMLASADLACGGAWMHMKNAVDTWMCVERVSLVPEYLGGK